MEKSKGIWWTGSGKLAWRDIEAECEKIHSLRSKIYTKWEIDEAGESANEKIKFNI